MVPLKLHRWLQSHTSQHKDLSYVYICENETVNGIEFDESLQELAKVCKEKNIELIADLSSDIFSREINIFDYGVIMAGAQKTLVLPVWLYTL